MPGIGEDLARKIREIVATGRLKLLKEVEARRGGNGSETNTLMVHRLAISSMIKG